MISDEKAAEQPKHVIEVEQSDEFKEWLFNLKDHVAKGRILIRFKRIEEGNLGDHKAIGDGISELRFSFGPGYRVYYCKKGDKIVLLLNGGDKDSQQRDINRAKDLAKEVSQDDPSNDKV